jgi:uncharacterized protein YbaR (Trm112 family)
MRTNLIWKCDHCKGELKSISEEREGFYEIFECEQCKKIYEISVTFTIKEVK